MENIDATVLITKYVDVSLPKVADFIFPIRYAALSRSHYLSNSPITGKDTINMDIALFSTNALPSSVTIVSKDMPDTNPVTNPATTTTAMVSSFKINPTIITRIPINLIKIISSLLIINLQRSKLLFFMISEN
jgi:hypothetical protein